MRQCSRNILSSLLRLTGSLVFALMVGLAAHSAASAQALIVDGETIADADLMAAAKKEGNLLVYGTWPERNFNPAVKSNFEKETGLKVNYIRMTTQVLFQRVTAEAAANRLAVDVIDVTDPILLQQLVDKKIMAVPYTTPFWDRIADAAKDPQGRWYAFYRMPIGIGVNTAVVKPADYPKHWVDLLDPKWKGAVGTSSLDVGGSAFSQWVFLRDKIAPDFWQRWRTNNVRVYPAVAPALADLVRGELSVAAMGVTSFLEQERDGAPLTTLLPPEGSPMLWIAGGISSTAKNQNAAKLFVNWLTSKHGGAAVAQQSSYGVNSDAPRPKLTDGTEFPPVETLWDIPVDSWEKIREPTSIEWRSIFR